MTDQEAAERCAKEKFPDDNPTAFTCRSIWANGFLAGITHERAKLQKVREALESAERRFSHIENWHRDNVTPDFEDCQEVGMTPEEYLRTGKNEAREALKLLEGE